MKRWILSLGLLVMVLALAGCSTTGSSSASQSFSSNARSWDENGQVVYGRN